MRFDHFMQHALYHPEQGYYTKKVRTIGKDGDFSTSATLSSALAHAIAQWIQEEVSHHRFSKTVNIVELGAGTGKLQKDIKSALPFLFRRKLKFHIVETSEGLRHEQRKLLGKSTTWHDSLASMLSQSGCAGEAIIYSNEFIDAFPVRQFSKQILTQGTEPQYIYSELYVDTQKRSEIFSTIESSELPESSAFSHESIGNKDKQLNQSTKRFEVCDSYHHYLDQWAPHFTKGSILTIDYGDTSESLIENNPKGTVRGFLKHQSIYGNAIYHSIGHQDITADVNFSDLILWSQKYQIDFLILSSQSDFLKKYTSNQNALKVLKEDAFLTNQDGAGTAFKVLHQRK